MKRTKIWLFLIALVTFLAVGFKDLKAEGGEKAEVNIQYLFLDEDPETQPGVSLDDEYLGTLLTVAAPDVAGYEFVYWIVNNTIREALEQEMRIYVQNDLSLIAVYKPTGTIGVVYVDSNGKLIDYEYLLEAGQLEKEVAIHNFSKPGATPKGFANLGGIKLDDEITKDTLFYLEYETELPGGVLIVNSVVEKASTLLNEEVTITSSEVDFAYWIDESGQVLSANKTYSFTMLGFD